MRIFCDVLKDSMYGFIVFNVNVYELESHSSRNNNATFCISDCTVAPPITSIWFNTGWLIGNTKRCYIQYEVVDDQFCGWSVTGLDPIASDFSVSCCYFELYEQMNTEIYTKFKYFCSKVWCVLQYVFNY